MKTIGLPNPKSTAIEIRGWDCPAVSGLSLLNPVMMTLV